METPSNYVIICPSEVIQDLGIASAGVFGVVYWYSKRWDGYCWASQEEIGKLSGLTSRSVRTHLQRLTEAGYIVPVDHDGKTNGYMPAHQWDTLITMRKGEEIGKNFRPNPKTEEKISDKEYYLRELNSSTTPQQAMVGALSDVMGMDIKLNAGRLGKFASSLVDAGYDAETVMEIYSPGGAWYTEEYYGQQGQIPNQYNIKATIAKLSTLRERKRSVYEQQLKDAGYE